MLYNHYNFATQLMHGKFEWVGSLLHCCNESSDSVDD